MIGQKYTSVQDVLDSLRPEDIKKELQTLNVKFHHNNKDETLAELLFETLKSKDTEKPKEDGVFNESWAELSKRIPKQAKRETNTPTRKTMVFIAKPARYHLAPEGISKEGKVIRYVKGYSSLSIAEQREQGDVFPLDLIRFEFTEGVEFRNSSGFKGLSRLFTSDETLIKYITSNKKYGQEYALLDADEMQNMKLEKRKKETLAAAAVYNAGDDTLIATLSFLNMREGGRDTYEALINCNSKTLKEKALQRVDNDIDEWLRAMGDKMASATYMVNRAKDLGIIKVSSDGRSITMASNSQEICKSSVATDWQVDLITKLSGTPEGQNILKKLEVSTGVKVV